MASSESGNQVMKERAMALFFLLLGRDCPGEGPYPLPNASCVHDSLLRTLRYFMAFVPTLLWWPLSLTRVGLMAFGNTNCAVPEPVGSSTAWDYRHAPLPPGLTVGISTYAEWQTWKAPLCLRDAIPWRFLGAGEIVHLYFNGNHLGAAYMLGYLSVFITVHIIPSCLKSGIPGF